MLVLNKGTKKLSIFPVLLRVLRGLKSLALRAKVVAARAASAAQRAALDGRAALRTGRAGLPVDVRHVFAERGDHVPGANVVAERGLEKPADLKVGQASVCSHAHSGQVQMPLVGRSPPRPPMTPTSHERQQEP